MRTTAVAAVAVAFLAASAGLTASAFDETEHIAKTARLDPGGTLHLKNFSGHVTITAENRTDVAVDAVRHATRDRLDRIKLDVHNEGGDLVVDANHRESYWLDWWGRNNVVETDFTIKVPQKTNLDVNVFSSSVTVQGVEGEHKLHGFSSRFELDDIVGPVQIHTFSGAVEIRERSWQPRASIDIDTFSGSVDLRLPQTAKAAVTFNSFSGHLDSAMPLTLNSVNTRRHGTVSAHLGADDADAGTLRVKTFSGSFRIDRE